MATATKQDPHVARATGSPDEVLVTEPVEPKKKPPYALILVGILLVVGLVWGVKRWSYGRNHESTDNAQVDGHIVPVLAKVGGYVVAVNAEENQPVKEGALLVQIDDAEYRVRLAAAEADFAAAQASAGGNGTTGQAQAQVAVSAGQSAASSAQVAAARANMQKADADLARFRTLADQQIISRQQLDAAQAAADAARANYEAVQRQAAAAGATVSSAEAGVRLANARLAAAKAARDNAALQESYTKITAPASGLVSKKTVEVGQLVQPGQTLLSVVPDTGVWVTANFKETQLDGVKPGQPVEIEVDAYGGCVAEGKVDGVSAATGAKFSLLPPDNATGNFTKVVQRVPVRILVTKGCGTDRPLRPGMSVVAHVKTR